MSGLVVGRTKGRAGRTDRSRSASVRSQSKKFAVTAHIMGTPGTSVEQWSAV